MFLIRHAPAAAETLQLADPARPLTREGRVQAKQLGEKLRWYDTALTHVFASPLVRAVQTAELVVAGIEDAPHVDILPPLAPDGSAREVLAALKALPASASVMLVAHEPGLSSIGGLLVGDASFGALDKTEAARIVDGHLRWRFLWSAEAPTPR